MESAQIKQDIAGNVLNKDVGLSEEDYAFGSPIPNSTSTPATQYTPISRILMARQKEDIYECNGSSILSPASPIVDYIAKVNELEQKIDLLKRDNSALRTDFLSEQEARYLSEKVGEEKQCQLTILQQALNKCKDELTQLRRDLDKKWMIEMERDQLKSKNIDLLERYENTKEKYSTSIENLKIEESFKVELEKQVRQYKLASSDDKAIIDQLKTNLKEFENICSHQEQELHDKEQQLNAYLVDAKQWKDDRDVLKEALDHAKQASRNVSASTIEDVTLGESMTVVTEFKVRELNEKINEMKSTWVDPSSAQTIKSQLASAIQDKTSQQNKYEKLKIENMGLQESLSAKTIENVELSDNLRKTQSQCVVLQKLADQHKIIEEHNVELQAELKNVEKDFLASREKLSLVEKLNSTLQHQKEDVSSHLEKTRHDVASKEKKIKLLLTQLGSMESELNKLENEISDLSLKLDDANEQYNEMQLQITSLKCKRDHMKVELTKKSSELNQEKIKFDKMNKNNVEMEDKMKKRITQLELQLDSTNFQVSSLTKEKSDVSDHLEIMQKQLKETQLIASSAAEEHVAKMDNLKLNVENLTSNLAQKCLENEEINQRCGLLQGKMETMNAQIISLESELDCLKNDFTKVEMALDQEKLENYEMEKQMQLIDKKLIKMAQYESEMLNLNEEMQKKKSEIEMNYNEMANMRNKITLLENSVKQELEIKNENLMEIKSLQKDNLIIEEKFKKAQEDLLNLMSEKDALKENCEKLEADLENGKQSHKEDMRLNKEHVTAMKERMAVLENQSVEIQNKLEKSKLKENEINLLKEKNENYLVQFEIISTEKHEIEQELSCLKSKQGEMESDFAKVMEDLKLQKTENTEMSEKIQISNEKMTSMESQLESTIGIKSDLEKMSKLQEDKLLMELNDKKKEASVLLMDKSVLESKVSKQNEQLDALKENCEKLEAALENGKQSHKEDLRLNKEHVTAMKERIAVLESQLVEIQNKLEKSKLKEDEINLLKEKNKNYLVQFEIISTEKHEIEQELSCLKSKQGGMESDFAKVMEDLKLQKTENIKMTEKIQINNEKMTSMESQLESTIGIKSDLEKMSKLQENKLLMELNDEKKEASVLLMDKSVLESKVSKQNEQLDALKENCEKLEADLENGKQSHKEDLRLNKEHVTAMKERMAVLESQLVEIQNKLEKSKLKEDEINLLKEKNENYLVQFEIISTEKHEIEQELSCLKSKQGEMESDFAKAMEDLKLQKTENIKMSEKIQISNEKMTSMESQLESTIGIKSDLEKMSKLQEDKLLMELNDKKKEASVLLMDKSVLESKVSKQNEQLDSLQDGYKKLSTDFQESWHQLNKSTNQHKLDLEEYENKIKALKLENKELHETWSLKAKTYIDELCSEKEKYNKLTRSAHEMNNDKLSWQLEMKQTNRRCDDARNEIMNLKEVLAAQAAQIKRDEAELNETKLELNSYKWPDVDTPHYATPLTRSKSQEVFKSPLPKYNNCLDDSLEFYAKDRSSKLDDTCHSTISSASSHFEASNPLSRSCLSMESSMLSSMHDGNAPHAFSTGDLSQAKTSHTDISKMSNFANNRRATLGPADLHRHGRPSLLGLPVLEEPDHPNYTNSLHRIVELQNRNSKQPAHMKSSYPVETQGKTPSRCDETIRIGDPNRTIRRISEIHECAPTSDQPGIATNRCIIRGLPGYKSSSHIQDDKQLHGVKRRNAVVASQDVPHIKTRRETIAPSASFQEGLVHPFDVSDASVNSNTTIRDNKENTRVRQSTKFDVTFTPPTRRSKSSKEANQPIATRTKSKTQKDVRKTPSLMERMRKPLGRLNPKK